MVPSLAFCLLLLSQTGASTVRLDLADFDQFHRSLAHYAEGPIGRIKEWRSLEPSVYRFLLEHQSYFGSLSADEQISFVNKLADFLIQRRRKLADMMVIGPGRPIIALLDEGRGTQRDHVEKLAAALKTRAKTFRVDDRQDAVQAVDGFLAAVAEAAGRGKPSTIVMLGHGLPREFCIASTTNVYVRQIAAALVTGSVANAKDGRIDLSPLCLVVDACYSGDFTLNLAKSIEEEAQSRAFAVNALPVLVSSAGRDQLAHGAAGSRNYPFFWNAIAGFYVDQQQVHQKTLERITLGNLFQDVDRRLYGLGRTPMLDSGAKVIGWRVVDKDMIQDPAFLVPLSDEEAQDLRELLGLPHALQRPLLLDLG